MIFRYLIIIILFLCSHCFANESGREYCLSPITAFERIYVDNIDGVLVEVRQQEGELYLFAEDSQNGKHAKIDLGPLSLASQHLFISPDRSSIGVVSWKHHEPLKIQLFPFSDKEGEVFSEKEYSLTLPINYLPDSVEVAMCPKGKTLYLLPSTRNFGGRAMGDIFSFSLKGKSLKQEDISKNLVHRGSTGGDTKDFHVSGHTLNLLTGDNTSRPNTYLIQKDLDQNKKDKGHYLGYGVSKISITDSHVVLIRLRKVVGTSPVEWTLETYDRKGDKNLKATLERVKYEKANWKKVYKKIPGAKKDETRGLYLRIKDFAITKEGDIETFTEEIDWYGDLGKNLKIQRFNLKGEELSVQDITRKGLVRSVVRKGKRLIDLSRPNIWKVTDLRFTLPLPLSLEVKRALTLST